MHATRACVYPYNTLQFKLARTGESHQLKAKRFTSDFFLSSLTEFEDMYKNNWGASLKNNQYRLKTQIFWKA